MVLLPASLSWAGGRRGNKTLWERGNVQCRNAVCDAQLSPGFGWDLGGAGLKMEHGSELWGHVPKHPPLIQRDVSIFLILTGVTFSEQCFHFPHPHRGAVSLQLLVFFRSWPRDNLEELKIGLKKAVQALQCSEHVSEHESQTGSF